MTQEEAIKILNEIQHDRKVIQKLAEKCDQAQQTAVSVIKSLGNPRTW